MWSILLVHASILDGVLDLLSSFSSQPKVFSTITVIAPGLPNSLLLPCSAVYQTVRFDIQQFQIPNTNTTSRINSRPFVNSGMM